MFLWCYYIDTAYTVTLGKPAKPLDIQEYAPLAAGNGAPNTRHTMNVVQLVPVSEWIYSLYKVEYWDADPENGGRVIRASHIAASSENHLNSDAWENAPRNAEYMTFNVVKEKVAQPRVIGSMHGVSIYESATAHGKRLAEQYGY